MGDKECIHNFDTETCWKAAALKIKMESNNKMDHK
jgi:hypothetical protein